MSTATETCACGASITVDVRDGLVLGFRLAEWRKEHQHDDEVERLRNWKAEALAVLAEWDGVYEALGSPASLRSAVVALTEERDAAHAEVERLDRDGRAVAGRCLHYEARAKKAEAAIARVRALTEDEWGPLSDDGERCAMCRRKWSKHDDEGESHYAASKAVAAIARQVLAALDGEGR